MAQTKTNPELSAYIVFVGMLIMMVPIVAGWETVRWFTTVLGILIASFSDKIAQKIAKEMKK